MIDIKDITKVDNGLYNIKGTKYLEFGYYEKSESEVELLIENDRLPKFLQRGFYASIYPRPAKDNPYGLVGRKEKYLIFCPTSRGVQTRLKYKRDLIQEANYKHMPEILEGIDKSLDNLFTETRARNVSIENATEKEPSPNIEVAEQEENQFCRFRIECRYEHYLLEFDIDTPVTLNRPKELLPFINEAFTNKAITDFEAEFIDYVAILDYELSKAKCFKALQSVVELNS